MHGITKQTRRQSYDGIRTRSGERCRLKLRLYELEAMLPASFIRINKSALANEAHLERFTVFRSGYREYVSRRCFAEIKRRYDHV